MSQAFKEFTLGGDNFAGTFDSVRIWNRALSTDEAKSLDLPKNKAGLIAHWRMEEGEGQYLYDSIGEHHGVASWGNSDDNSTVEHDRVARSWVHSRRINQEGQFQFYIDGTKVAHDEPNQSYSYPPMTINLA